MPIANMRHYTLSHIRARGCTHVNLRPLIHTHILIHFIPFAHVLSHIHFIAFAHVLFIKYIYIKKATHTNTHATAYTDIHILKHTHTLNAYMIMYKTRTPLHYIVKLGQ